MAVPASLPALLARAEALRVRRDALLAAKKGALLARASALRARSARLALRAAAARTRLAAAAGRYYRPQFADEELGRLTRYKNKGADFSVTYKYVMGPFYDWLIRFVPAGLAPNAVTLLGFVLILASHGVMMFYAPTLSEECPRWVYVFVGVSLWTYMVLDNLDGRQARRTGSSSPLGHLFDHGCDAFNVTISGVSFMAMLQLGPGLASCLMLFAVGHLICYAASLEEYFTGAMILREINGPNEGLILMSGLHILTGVLGPQIWRAPLTILGYTLPRNEWVGIGMSAPAAVTVFGNIAAVVEHVGRRDIAPRTALRKIASASANFTLYGVSLLAWAALAPAEFEAAILPVLWLSCVNFFYMISRMIICHLTGTVYPLILRATLPQVFCAANTVVGVAVRGAPFVPQEIVIAVTLLWTTAFNAWRIYCMILQICDYLNIRCLHLGPLRPPSADGTPDFDEGGFHGNHHLVHKDPAPIVFCGADFDMSPVRRRSRSINGNGVR